MVRRQFGFTPLDSMPSKTCGFLRGKHLMGFTLIELLLVVAILATLVALLLPRFGSTGKRAREARAEADCWTLRTAILMYHHDTGQYPGSGGTADITTSAGFNDYLVDTSGSGSAVSGWNGSYCDSVDDDPWGNSYIFNNRFDTGDYACIASRGENGTWNSNLNTRTTGGDDIVLWME